MPRQEFFCLHLALLRVERADGVNQKASGFQPSTGAVQQPRLHIGQLGDIALIAVECQIGVAAQRAAGRTRRVQNYGVKWFLRLPVKCVGCDRFGAQFCAP